MAAKKGLGRGLDALIPTDSPKTNKSKNTSGNKKATGNGLKTSSASSKKPSVQENIPEGSLVQTMKITDIEPNPDQPRKNFEEDPLQELADSIKEYGVIDPIIVTRKNKSNLIIAGERRWRAARLVGLKEVPVIVREYNEQEIAEISLIENIQREDLNPIEEALAYQRLIQEFSLKQDELAERVSKSRTVITNTLRLLKLTDKVQQMVIDEKLSNGHARALLALEDPKLQYEAACQVFDENLSVRQTEALVKKYLNGVSDNSRQKQELDHSSLYTATEEELKNILGSKVTIRAKDNQRGKIEIEYYSIDELDGLIDHLKEIRK
ncbi:MAG: ParB/RepB/Spo0J family partition protein [Lachnospiraceae bacterium]|nr:ParB/RepB/Spo0J family partition protein [Lachnospiraceae bacterium]